MTSKMKFITGSLALLLFSGFTGEAQYYPPPDSLGGWRTLTGSVEIKEKAGMDLTKLDTAFEYIKKSSKNGGLLVLRNGWLVYERYFGKGHREALPNLGSCGKSFTGIAVGILMSERSDLFPDGLDQKIFTPAYFPNWVFPLSDPRKSEIRLGQLLTFTAGIRGNNPVYVNGKQGTIDPVGPDGYQAMEDSFAMGITEGKTGNIPFSAKTLWCDPGKGYSYATASIHIASIMLRHIAGMELQEYIDQHIGKVLGWGRWGYGYKNQGITEHTPGGGGIALRSTDMLRFGYLLLNKGRWENKQVVPEKYVDICSHVSPYNPHYPFSLQFKVNTNGYWPTLPKDAFWKAGSGNHCLYIVPSLNLVVWKLGGRDGQYDPKETGIPPDPDAIKSSDERKGWKMTVNEEEDYIKTLELVIESIEKY